MMEATPDVPPVAPPGRIAIVGAGAFARFCIDAYARSGDLRVMAVADPDPAALIRVPPEIRRASDWRQIVDDESIEVVHLATPPFLRRDIATAAMGSGKSVFCEKPLALSLSAADAMIDRAREAGVTLGVDYVMRHHPAYRVLEAVATSRVAGEIRTLSLQNFAQQMPPDHWFWDVERSGGILVEHGVHFFDAYGRIAGAPLTVGASAPRTEAVDATVWYRSGAIGRFYHEFAYPREVELTTGIAFFESGFVEIRGWIPTSVRGAVVAPVESVRQLLSRPGSSLEVDEDEPAALFELQFPERQAAYAAAVVAGMRDTVHQHRDPGHVMAVSADDARESLRVALAAQRALSTGKKEEVKAREPVANVRG
jgi:predicted dehydrogenase